MAELVKSVQIPLGHAKRIVKELEGWKGETTHDIFELSRAGTEHHLHPLHPAATAYETSE